MSSQERARCRRRLPNWITAIPRPAPAPARHRLTHSGAASFHRCSAIEVPTQMAMPATHQAAYATREAVPIRKPSRPP